MINSERKQSTTEDARLKRLRYRSWHRGCKETDLILGRFADGGLSTLPEPMLTVYEQLLDENDADIWDWIIGKPGAKLLQPFVENFYSKYKSQGRAPGIESPNARFMREDAAMLAALQATKFEDPAMENYRKHAIKNWNDHATAQQGFIERMIETGGQLMDASTSLTANPLGL